MEFLEIENHYFKLEKDEKGNPVRLLAYHFNHLDQQCGGEVPIHARTQAGDGWVLINEDPLDVRPSIDCDLCPSHYTIVRGRIFDHNKPENEGFSQEDAMAIGEENQQTIVASNNASMQA